jgi:predicted phosphoribosyltransferase
MFSLFSSSGKIFNDRNDAGKQLLIKLKKRLQGTKIDKNNTIVISLPRGGGKDREM